MPQCCDANVSRTIPSQGEKPTEQENRPHGMKLLWLLFSVFCGTRRPSWTWWMFLPFLLSSLPVSRDGWARTRPLPTWGSQIHGTLWVSHSLSLSLYFLNTLDEWRKKPSTLIMTIQSKDLRQASRVNDVPESIMINPLLYIMSTCTNTIIQNYPSVMYVLLQGLFRFIIYTANDGWLWLISSLKRKTL